MFSEIATSGNHKNKKKNKNSRNIDICEISKGNPKFHKYRLGGFTNMTKSNFLEHTISKCAGKTSKSKTMLGGCLILSVNSCILARNIG